MGTGDEPVIGKIYDYRGHFYYNDTTLLVGSINDVSFPIFNGGSMLEIAAIAASILISVIGIIIIMSRKTY